ncbi:MAG: DUF937 domain-containing protein [Erysipelotrichaceae bacterium]|nr:DUF937 domain-containing protein [Erysipelotrichaceae bacterium]
MANNDLNALLGQLLNADTLSAISGATGVSSSDTKNVLANALPLLLNGANNQAASSKTVESFLGALTQHAADDSSNINSFFKNVDLDDGAKIIKHLLGGETKSVTENVAKKANTNSTAASKVLSAAAPLLLTLIGKSLISNVTKSTKKKSSAVSTTDLLGALLGAGTTKASSANMTADLLGTLLGAGTSSKKSSSVSDVAAIANLVSSFLK